MRQEDLPEPDPRAMHFPTTTEQVSAPGTVFKALPINPGMVDCYVSHRTMHRVPNGHYPLACQVCDRADAEDRWKCQWCYVRMCDGCYRLFNNYRRDLPKLMEHVEKHGPSEKESSRPTSAGPLETVHE